MDFEIPAMTPLSELLNPEIRPHLAVTTVSRDSQRNSKGSLMRKLKRSMSLSHDPRTMISPPGEFRHIVHVGTKDIGMDSLEKRTVELSRKNQPNFGITFQQQEGQLVISDILEGGAAQRCGLLKKGYLIWEIDGTSVEGLDMTGVQALLAEKDFIQLLYNKPPEAAPAEPEADEPVQKRTSSLNNVGSKKADRMSTAGPSLCRVCQSVASFNCSACGPSIAYCSSDCQKKDWTDHQAECLLMKKSKSAQEEQEEKSKITAGACRICRSQRALYRCVCRSAMYCSTDCQKMDWPSHQYFCKIKTKNPGGEVFYVGNDFHVSCIVFENGVFNFKWLADLSGSEDLSPQEEQMSPLEREVSSFCTLLKKDGTLFVAVRGYVIAMDADMGTLKWKLLLSYPFDLSPVSLAISDQTLLVGARGHLAAIDVATGKEVWRKLLHRSFADVTLLIQGAMILVYCGGTIFGGVLSDLECRLGWRFRLPLEVEHSAMMGLFLDESEMECRVIVAAEGLSALSLRDGVLVASKFARSSDVPSSVSSVALHNAAMLIRLQDGRISRYDPETLTKVWTSHIDDCAGHTGTLMFNDIILCGTRGDKQRVKKATVIYVGIYYRVVALNAADGEELWTAKLHGSEIPSGNGLVTMTLIGEDLVAATSGRVYGLSANNGNPLRKARLPRKQQKHAEGFVSMVESQGTNEFTSCPSGMVPVYRPRERGGHG
eukprot:Lithocolla_globosa_v1_NODE_1810_length_2321_cov_11.696823.p1 type:complete len:714 gc:universal NODE_1810_length_2321_cov_11.696823:2265-124(-)